MASNKMNPKADFFFRKNEKWQKEIEKLRSIILNCGLTEELKWGCPCYTVDGHNIVLIHCFKEYCALLFFKGVLLKDPAGILIQQTKNVQVPRQARFTGLAQIKKLETVLKTYIKEAIEVEKSGKKVQLKTTAEYDMPAEFKEKLKEMPDLQKAFKALTPGRQRGYLYYFSQAKLSKTRMERVEKYIPQILAGKGVDD